MTEFPATEAPAVEIKALSKRYRRHRGGRVPLPFPFSSRKKPERPEAEDMTPDVDVDDLEEGDSDLEEVDERIEADEKEEEEERPDQAVWALRDVFLDVPPGTMLGFIGPNGSGKTTLLRILTRLTPPTQGTVILRGRAAPLIPSLPGVMLPGDSLRQNVVQVARFFGIPKEIAVARTEEVGELAELGDLLDQRVGALSRGELKRFAFAIALQLEPDILIADDVIAVGDKHFQQRCIEHIRTRVEEGLTALFASHNLDLIGDLCSETVLLEGGRIMEKGPTEAVIARYLGTSAASGSRVPAAGAIQSAELFSESGRAETALHVSEGALVEVVLDLPEAPTTVRCALALRSPDETARATQPAPVTLDDPGRYVISAVIPGDTLSGGVYRADVAAFEFTADGRQPLGRVKDAFEFEVFGIPDGPDLSGTPDVDFVRGAPAKRRLDLTWSVAPADDPVASIHEA